MDLVGAAPARLEPTEQRLRAQMIDAGVAVTYALVVAMAGWVVLTWHRPHRPVITALLVSATVAAFAVSRLPRERIIDSRWREPFFICWSMLDILFIAAIAALDGGATSPTTLACFLTVVFAALSYPLRAVVFVSVVNLAAFLALAVAGGGGTGRLDGSFIWLFAVCLTLASAMCVWHARLHADHRRELARTSRTDPLTGSLNRRGIEERIDDAIADAAAGARPLALVVLDVDDFKAVNDTYGHAAGDDLLRWTVRAAYGVLRPEDALGRLGGDEFAVVLPDTDQAGAEAVAQRLHDALGERVAVSAGVAAFPGHGATRDELHRHADADLYAVKRARVAAATAGAIGVDALSAALDARDQYTGEHSEQVVALASAVARELGFEDVALREVAQVARLHDVGKLGVPDAILKKPGRLDESEWAVMREHPAIGAHIAASIPALAHLAPMIRAEHERWDGDGYPDGRAGEAIPPASRIVFACDAYHAMTSDRPYRAALPHDHACRELEDGAGKQFDPAVVRALLAVLGTRDAARAAAPS